MIPLRTSHIVFYSAVVTVTVTLAMAVGFWFIRREMLAGNDFLLDAESKEILARVAPLQAPIDSAEIEQVLKEHTKNDEALFYFQVHDPAGKVIYHSPNLGAEALTDLTGGFDKRTLNLPPFGLLRVAEYHSPALHVQIAMSLRNFQSVNHTFLIVFLLGIPLIACLSVGFGMVLRRATLSPIRLMQATAQRITANNLSERIPVPPGGGEMAALVRLLNEMIDRLEKSFKHAKRFTADVSHELMTPLSVIRLHTERLLNDPELPAKHRHSVEEQLQETLFLTEIIERLLVLAKADASVLVLKPQCCQVNDFMTQFAEDALLLTEDRGLKLVMVQGDCGVVTFDQGWIRQVLFNLLSNSLRFSPPGGTVTIHSTCADGYWSVEVQDEGPGVPPDRVDDIFGRFVQIAARSGPGSGAGLGLAICKSIIDMHRGRISAKLETERSGLVVTFFLPLTPASTV